MAARSPFNELDEQPSGPYPEPPVVSAVQVLPFGELTWENFERLSYRLARTRAECEDARRFGIPGQSQSGIDLYCRRADGFTVVQCRRVGTLTPSDLDAAVDDFLTGDWKSVADHFVFCTSRPAVRTELADEILNQANRLKKDGIGFEVWDAEELSAQLKEHAPDLVGDFFGPAWRDAFLPELAAASMSSQLAEISSQIERLRSESLRIRFVDWAPSLLRDALTELASDQATCAKLDDAVGIPPSRLRVAAVAADPPDWLQEADDRPWRVIALTAEKLGEWKAASDAWESLARRNDGDASAGFLVAASASADVGGLDERAASLLDAAEQLSPHHPRVVLQRLDQGASGPDRLRALDGLESTEPEVAALIAVHRATAYMLVPDMEEAERHAAEAVRLLPDSIAVRATLANLAIHHARIATNEHRHVDFSTVDEARRTAVQIRDELRDVHRYSESLRMTMLAADALTVVRERRRARALLMDSLPEELQAEDAAVVLGDAALRAGGWAEALALTRAADDTDAIRRIVACAHLEVGDLHQQNVALGTLDELILQGGREAPQAALYRIAATIGRRKANWSEMAFRTVHDAGYASSAITGKALYLALRERNYSAALGVLAPYAGHMWADSCALQVATHMGAKEAIRAAADTLLRNGAVQEDSIDCGVALNAAGETDRARDILSLAVRDPSTAPRIRAHAYAALVALVAETLGDWREAAKLHEAWTTLCPDDERASAWAPRIANQLAQARR